MPETSPSPPPAKPWWRSKTVWTNALKPSTAALIAAAANVGLRAVTRQPIGPGDEPTDGLPAINLPTPPPVVNPPRAA